MKKGKTYIAVVLDRSGSMSSIKADTIGGFNTFLKDQKAQPGEATITLAQFDDKYDIVYNDINIHAAAELNDSTFVPRGMTALYDAVCRTIDTVGSDLHSLKESDKPEKVIFVIITDGGENSSQEFKNIEAVKSRIKEQTEKYNWQFVFLAANQDAMEVGASMNIARGSSMTYSASPEAVQHVFLGMSKKMSAYRGGLESNMSYTDLERKEQEEVNKKGK